MASLTVTCTSLLQTRTSASSCIRASASPACSQRLQAAACRASVLQQSLLSLPASRRSPTLRKAQADEEMREKVDEGEAVLTKEPVKAEAVTKEAEKSLGVVGNVIMWSFLSVLLAASLFFTTARSFQPNDMQPLDAAQQMESQRS